MRLKKLIFIIGILISVSFVFASFQFNTHTLQKTYSIGEILKGSMNIGFNDTLGETLLTAFSSNISLQEFLDANNAVYSCEGGCNQEYSISNALPSRTFSLNYTEEKIIGFKISGQINEIEAFSFDVSSNAAKSCENPLKIDLFDDGSLEYISEEASNDFNCLPYDIFGCFDKTLTVESTVITRASYCEKIWVPVSSEYKLGAIVEKVKGNENVTFTFIIESEDSVDYCDVSTNEGGTISCVISEFFLENDSQVNVCMELSNADVIDATKEYKINFEDNEPCGYNELGATKISHDFEIFARPARYARVGNFVFNKASTGLNLTTKIENYIAQKYNYNCTPECIIPIKFKAGIKQDITASNLRLTYLSELIRKESGLIYAVSKPDIVITSNPQTLDIAKAGFVVPLTLGNKSVSLKLGDQEIFKDSIQVKSLPKVTSITPQTVPALMENKFIAIIGGDISNLTGISFIWDFGDGETGASVTNQITHRYEEEGEYVLSVTMKSNLRDSTKEVLIEVKSPKDAIIPTINDYNARLNALEPKINALPSWIKAEINNEVDIPSLRAEIQKQADAFPLVIVDEGYLEIMETLVSLIVPESLKIINLIGSPTKVFPNPDQLDLDVMEDLGAGTYSGESEDYAASVNSWINENLDITLEAKEYYFSYPEIEEFVFSYYKLILTPTTTTNEIYFSVSGYDDEVFFKEDYVLEGDSEITGFEISGLSEAKTLEFLYPGEVEIGNFPFYLSPSVSKLDLSIVSGDVICNQNSICEPERGEDTRNCREDCKPIVLTGLFLIILLIVFFIVYIVLQEWYKRHYEAQLFADKNKLFNLINFMNNASNQGMNRNQIINKLQEIGWKRERIIYAWKKLNGQRTGMWEIPVFKWVEKNQVKKELEKRGAGPAMPSNPPKPFGRPPARGMPKRPTKNRNLRGS